MKVFLRILMLTVSIAMIGCSDPLAEFSDSSDIKIPQPTFEGKTEKTTTVASPFVEIPINGECDVRTKALSTMIEGFQDWTTVESVSATNPTIDCSAKVFSFSLPSLKAFNKFDLNQKVTFSLKIKALTVAGYSEASTLTVVYDPNSKPPGTLPGFAINSGGNSSTSTSFKMKSRVSFHSEQQMTSPHFKIKTGLQSVVK